MTDWSTILRGQVLSCGEISRRMGKSRPTVLKMLQEAVKEGLLEVRKKDSSVFYHITENVTKADVTLGERE